MNSYGIDWKRMKGYENDLFLNPDMWWFFFSYINDKNNKIAYDFMWIICRFDKVLSRIH